MYVLGGMIVYVSFYRTEVHTFDDMCFDTPPRVELRSYGAIADIDIYHCSQKWLKFEYVKLVIVDTHKGSKGNWNHTYRVPPYSGWIACHSVKRLSPDGREQLVG